MEDSPSRTLDARINSAVIPSSVANAGQKLAGFVLQGLVECAVAIRTRDVVANLLDFNSSEQSIGKKSPCNVRALIEESLKNNQSAAAKKQILFQTGISPGLWVRADRQALAQVLDSLIANAVKCSPPNATVQVHALPEENQVAINVRDQGPGINEAGQRKLFQKIARLMTFSKDGTFSNDIGQTMVKKCSQALSGSIHWRSSRVSGSTFTLKLPISGPGCPPEIPDIKLLARTIMEFPDISRTYFRN